MDDLDSAKIQRQFETAKAMFTSAAAGSLESAEAEIDMEVYRTMASAVGMTLS